MQQHEHRKFKGVPELKQSKQKEQAVAFYAQHNVTGALETLLNTMYLEAPEDVYGYMVSNLLKCEFEDYYYIIIQLFAIVSIWHLWCETECMTTFA